MTTKQYLRALDRKGEKLRRLAYELEADASALRAMGGVHNYADGVRDISSRAGNIGRALCDLAESIR